VTLVAKLGSSIVAADDGELRVDVLDSVCAQVAELEQQGERIVLVTSGAIARGMRLVELPKRPTAMDALQAASAIGQGDLFRAYEQRLARHGTRAAQVLLTLSDISERAHYVNARQTLQRLVNWQVVPVINENDTTSTDEITFGDNDFLAAQVAVLLGARLLILLTNTDGLFTADPRSDPDARLVREVSKLDELQQINIGSGTSSFGRGGMESKVSAAKIASQSEVEVIICNGTTQGTLKEAAAGKPVGTRFAPHAGKRTPPYKLWLRHAKEPAGALYVDNGAAERLREGGASLLAVGVVDVSGSFKAGDAVFVLAESDSQKPEVIGKGIAEYSVSDVSAVMGLQSKAIRERFPDADGEVIHRDKFVLL
jgi:glutamate 5-kinase